MCSTLEEDPATVRAGLSPGYWVVSSERASEFVKLNAVMSYYGKGPASAPMNMNIGDSSGGEVSPAGGKGHWGQGGKGLVPHSMSPMAQLM